MNDPVDVSKIFAGILSDAMDHVAKAHGGEAAHRLFFELYSHTFDFLDREFGFGAVQKFWEHIADHQLGSLEHLMRTKGFEGMEEYWSAVVAQEGAKIEMKRTADSFRLVVKQCPPCDWFKEKHLPHYTRYPQHCAVLYERIANRCGFDMRYSPPDETAGTCCALYFTRKPKP